VSEPLLDDLTFRPMTLDDIGHVPIGHQGTPSEVAARIESLGTSAILAFHSGRHVGQLQLRPYVPAVRSAGLFDPLYWGDFSMVEAPLPAAGVCIHCYHVGQVDDSDERDTRYQGVGIGARLLDVLLAWADEHEIPAVIAKAVPPYRPVTTFMGGQPASIYLPRGFSIVDSWVEGELREVIETKGWLGEGADLDAGARMRCAVRLRGGERT
jgi:GNAT superfamily N-acetyltransferase